MAGNGVGSPSSGGGYSKPPRANFFMNRKPKTRIEDKKPRNGGIPVSGDPESGGELKSRSPVSDDVTSSCRSDDVITVVLRLEHFWKTPKITSFRFCFCCYVRC